MCFPDVSAGSVQMIFWARYQSQIQPIARITLRSKEKIIKPDRETLEIICKAETAQDLKHISKIERLTPAWHRVTLKKT